MNIDARQTRISRIGLWQTVLAALTAGALSAGAAEKTPSTHEWEGQATAGFTYTVFDGGFSNDESEFVTRYTPLRSSESDDLFFDLAEVNLSLVDTATQRRVVDISRTSHGFYNQQGSVVFDPEPVRLSADYWFYRSNQLRPRHMGDPRSAALTPGGNEQRYMSTFNDDSFGMEDFHIERLDFDFELKLRPQVAGHDGSQFGDLDLFVHKSDRDGMRYFDYITTARNNTGYDFHTTRWRGIDQEVIHDVNGAGLRFNVWPLQLFTAHYEIYVEKFDNRRRGVTLRDVANRTGLPVYTTTQVSTNIAIPGGFQDPSRTDFIPLDQFNLGFIPDSLKLINKVQLERSYGWAAWNAGYANVWLDQDSFSVVSRERGYEQGRITQHSAYGNWEMSLGDSVTWAAHVNYWLRDNNSTFPATGVVSNRVGLLDFINPLSDGGLHSGVFHPWMDQIETLKYGTDFTVRCPWKSSRAVVGWEREDTSRNLVFGTPSDPTLARTIDPNEAWIQEDTQNDTFFLKYSIRPMRNLQVRLDSSVTLGDEVSMATDNEFATKHKVSAAYSIPNLMQGATINAFYQHALGENNDLGINSISNGVVVASTRNQDREFRSQSAGVTLTLSPVTKANWYGGYVWNQDRLRGTFLRTSIRRYELSPWVWAADPVQEEQLADVHTVFAGCSYQFTAKLTGLLDYSVSIVDGELGSATVADRLGSDNDLNNRWQQIGATLEYRVNDRWSAAARYAYNIYSDDVNKDLSGHYHTVGTYLTMKF